MPLRKDVKIAQQALDDLKAIDLITLDVQSFTPFISYMLICTGSSSRHVKALADNVELVASQNNIKIVSYESDTSHDWVLVDLGDVVVHVMQEATREFYNLEKLWGEFDEQPLPALTSLCVNEA